MTQELPATTTTPNLTDIFGEKVSWIMSSDIIDSLEEIDKKRGCFTGTTWELVYYYSIGSIAVRCFLKSKTIVFGRKTNEIGFSIDALKSVDIFPDLIGSRMHTVRYDFKKTKKSAPLDLDHCVCGARLVATSLDKEGRNVYSCSSSDCDTHLLHACYNLLLRERADGSLDLMIEPPLRSRFMFTATVAPYTDHAFMSCMLPMSEITGVADQILQHMSVIVSDAPTDMSNLLLHIAAAMPNSIQISPVYRCPYVLHSLDLGKYLNMFGITDQKIIATIGQLLALLDSHFEMKDRIFQNHLVYSYMLERGLLGLSIPACMKTVLMVVCRFLPAFSLPTPCDDCSESEDFLFYVSNKL